jgi:hypothetical protein
VRLSVCMVLFVSVLVPSVLSFSTQRYTDHFKLKSSTHFCMHGQDTSLKPDCSCRCPCALWGCSSGTEVFLTGACLLVVFTYEGQRLWETGQGGTRPCAIMRCNSPEGMCCNSLEGWTEQRPEMLPFCIPGATAHTCCFLLSSSYYQIGT